MAKIGACGVSGKTAFDAKRTGCLVGNAVVEKYTELFLPTIFQPEAVVIGVAIPNEKNYLADPINKK